MLYIALLANIINLFLNPHYENLPTESNWQNNLASFEIAGEYGPQRKSNFIISAEYTGKNINDVFRFKTGALITSAGSFVLSGGVSKDLFFMKRAFFSTHFMPSIAFYEGGDREDAPSGIKFNIGVELGYLISKDFAVSVQWRHISSNYTTMPNNAIESIGIKLKFAF